MNKKENLPHVSYVKNPEEQSQSREQAATKKLRKMIYAALAGIGAIGLLKGGVEVATDRAKEKIAAAGIAAELADNPDLLEKALLGASVEELRDWASNLPDQSWENNRQAAIARKRVITPDGDNAPASVSSEGVYVDSEEMLTPPEENPFGSTSSEENPFEQGIAESVAEVQTHISPVPIPETSAAKGAEILTPDLAAGVDNDPFTYKKEEIPSSEKIPLSRLAEDVYSFKSRDTVEITSLSFQQYLKNYVSLAEADLDLDNDSEKLSIAVRDDSEKVFKIFPLSQILNYKVRFGLFFIFPGDEVLIGNTDAIEAFLSARGQYGKLVETADTPAAENQENN